MLLWWQISRGGYSNRNSTNGLKKRTIKSRNGEKISWLIQINDTQQEQLPTFCYISTIASMVIFLIIIINNRLLTPFSKCHFCCCLVDLNITLPPFGFVEFLTQIQSDLLDQCGPNPGPHAARGQLLCGLRTL